MSENIARVLLELVIKILRQEKREDRREIYKQAKTELEKIIVYGN